MKLRPCPFCGSTALILSHSGTYTISCYKCDCDGPAETDRSASVIAWNRRAYDDLGIMPLQPTDVIECVDNDFEAAEAFKKLLATLEAFGEEK